MKTKEPKNKEQAIHKLKIISLNDAQAECLCGEWHYFFTGERSRPYLQGEYNKHIKTLGCEATTRAKRL